MELFKKGKVIKSWGVVFAGLKRQWLTPTQVVKYCKEGSIVCNELRLEKLKAALDDSLFDFFKLIKEFIIEDGQPEIAWNEDSLREFFYSIPQQYLVFWEIEFLLRVVSSNEDNEEKLYKVFSFHADYNFPASWNNFLYIGPEEVPGGIDGKYSNLLDYIELKLNRI